MENRFLLGSGTRNINSTGGEETHTLSINEMPKHTHQMGDRAVYPANGSGHALIEYGSSQSTQNRNTSSTGGGLAHNNMPPFLVVNMWKRTA